MKKCFKFLSMLITCLITLSCSVSINPDTNSNGEDSSGVPLELVNTKDGVIVKLPPIPEGTTEFTIYRTNIVTKNQQLLSPQFYDDFSAKSVMDYFVEPNTEYVYKLKCYGQNRKVSYESASTPIPDNNGKTIGGDGELKFAVLPKASFNTETSIMTFETMAEVPSYINEKLTREDWLNINLYYKSDKTSTQHAINNCKEINFYEDLARDFGNNFQFNLLEINFSINNIVYYQAFKPSQINTNPDSPNLPPIIKADDNRSSLIIHNTSDGIVIDLPETRDVESRFSITRTNLVTNTSVMLTIFNLGEYHSNNVTDHFVNPGDKYQYMLKVVKNNSGASIYESRPTCIPDNDGKAIGGVGELRLDKNPKATYNQETGIMTFETLPDLPKPIKDLIIEPTDYYNIYLQYLSQTGNFFRIKTNNKIIDLNTSVPTDCLNKKLRFNDVEIELKKDGVQYSYRISDNEINTNPASLNIPPIITITGKDKLLQMKNTQEGIVIELPKLPTEAIRCQVVRENITKNTSINFSINDLTKYNSKIITDVFINPGDKYKYVLRLFNKNYSTLFESSVTYIPDNGGKALGGLGDLELGNSPKASFNKETSIMTFETLPKLTEQQIKSLNGPNDKYNFTMYYVDEKNNLGLQAKVAQTVDCSNFVVGQSYDKNLIFRDFYLKVYKNGLIYDVRNIKSKSLPSPIFIKDNRPKVTLVSNANSNGVIITFDNTDSLSEYSIVAIQRYNKNAPSDIFDYYIQAPISKNTSIYDYFTNPNEEYEYKVSLMKNNGIGVDLPSCKVIAKSGLGYGIKENTKLRYDKNTKTSTISPMPSFDFSTVNINHNVNILPTINYVVDNTEQRIEGQFNEKGVINWGNQFDNYNGIPLSLGGFSMNIYIDSIFYHLVLSVNELKPYLDTASFDKIIN